jgi:hypothetical protein
MRDYGLGIGLRCVSRESGMREWLELGLGSVLGLGVRVRSRVRVGAGRVSAIEREKKEDKTDTIDDMKQNRGMTETRRRNGKSLMRRRQGQNKT